MALLQFPCFVSFPNRDTQKSGFYFLAFGKYAKVLDCVSSLLLSLPQEERYNTQSAAADIIAWEKSHGRDSPGGHDAG
jgi:hypothetical protein